MGNLVTRTEVKEFMQVTGTATDSIIDTYIDIIEAEIDAELDKTLALATYTEPLKYLQSTFDQTEYTYLDASQSTPEFILKHTPVTNISISVNGTALPTTSYSYNPKSGVVTMNDVYSDPTATYVAGYTTLTAPADLRGVIKMGVASLYNNNKAAQQGSGGVKSKRIKDFSVDYGDSQNSLTQNLNGKIVKTYIASNEVILTKYKNTHL